MTEFRLSPEAKSRVLRLNFIFGGVFVLLFAGQAVLYFVAKSPATGAAFIALAVFLGVGTVVLTRRFVDRSLVRFGNGVYEVWWIFRVDRFTSADALQVVTANNVALGLAPGAPLLIVAGATKRLTILTGQMWSTDQLGALATDLAARGTQLLSYPQRLSASQLRTMDRRWMPFWQAHPIAVGLFIGLGVLVFASVATVVTLLIVR